MKKIIYSTVCSLVIFSCSTQIIEPIKNNIIEKKNDIPVVSVEDKIKADKLLKIPELILKTENNIYLGSIFKLNTDFKDEKGNIINDFVFTSSDEKIAKIEDNFVLNAILVGKVTITATSKKNNILKIFELNIVERAIKSITVKSKKDRYVIAKTGELKQQFNFDTTLESQETFETEVEYQDGTKTNNVIWESDNDKIISVENGKIKGISYGSTYIKVYTTDNKSQKIVFRVNFLANLKTACIDEYSATKYSDDSNSSNSEYSNLVNDGKSDIKEIATFNGKNYNITSLKEMVRIDGSVFDTSGFPVFDAKVSVKVLERCIDWLPETQYTKANGKYKFDKVPVGVRIEITAEKDNWTKRLRTEVLKSGFSDPKINFFDFGKTVGVSGTDPNNLYSIQDEPEITMIKINDNIVLDSDSLSTGNGGLSAGPSPKNPNILKPSLTGVSSDSLKIELFFSELVKKEDIENYFRITSQEKFNNKKESFVIDKNNPNLKFTWADDSLSVKIELNKPILANRREEEAKYMIDFIQGFRDKTDKVSKPQRFFRFSPAKINDFTIFSVKNKDLDPVITNIQAINSDVNDIIKITFNTPMDVINQTVPQALLSDPNYPNNPRINLLAYNTENKDSNNVTILGYKENISGNFKAVYSIGIIKADDLENASAKKLPKGLFLKSLGGNFSNTPLKYGGDSKSLKSVKLENNVITIELNPLAFDKNDKIIVSAGEIEGSYEDKINYIFIPSLKTVLPPNNTDFMVITDPSGRGINKGNPSILDNIYINNSQKSDIAN